MVIEDMEWIAVDWGTSHLRVWAMSADDDVLARAQSDRGMGQLTREQFEPALLELVGDWLIQPRVAVACGMVGSRQGWIEAPYQQVPCAPGLGQAVLAPTQDKRLAVYVIPGLRQDAPADVMRGEETQIAGFLAFNPGWDGVLCLPGSHTKWAHISASEVVSFQTFMTGELFAAISDHTVLRHSATGPDWAHEAFEAAVTDALSKPEMLAARLFSLRAEGLLHGMSPGAARARLSGLLIGAELAGSRPYWLGQNIAVLGDDAIARCYADALALQGHAPLAVNAETATLAGLSACHSALKVS